jgi:para-aminobenzoate synthetase / 4-amino-4-deoxychorismate lyase
MNRRQSLPAEVYALPVEVYALVDRTPATVLLEGGSPHPWRNSGTALEVSHPVAEPASYAEPATSAGRANWTRLFTAPARILVAHQSEEIPALFREIESAVAAGQFAAGFFAYESGQAFEPKAQMRKDPGRPLAQPLAWLGIYDRAFVFDHASGEFIGGEPPGLAELRLRPPAQEGSSAISSEFPLTESEYALRIAQIHKWIRAGDVYQLNFTAPLSIRFRASAAALYAQLRARQPVDYGAFLHSAAGRRILSFSPELFFRMERESETRRIVTRPMKGTAPRGRTTREDRERAAWLRADPKNRSENLMIVDLLRNDLGRIARFGSVCVDNLFALERHPTLWQMTSTVSANLRDNIGFEEIFRALFPSGSVTGAPKIRAMQLIAEIESAPRGVYTGAIGFFSREQTVFNVAIRTLALEGALEGSPEATIRSSPCALHGSMGLGSGIVIDSEPAAEYRECLLKAEFLTRASADFSLVETMVWDGSFPLPHFPFLELHLERLADSADYFDFSCDLSHVRAALEVFAGRFPDPAPRKFRLLLERSGAITLSDELLPPGPNPLLVASVRIASTRTDPADPFLFHKTTHRPFYAQEFEAAQQAGFDDVLFFNLRGELTEGAISNVFLAIEDRWFTPPIACGLLAGVYRRHLLESSAQEAHPKIEERILREDDLRRADAIYLSNAVRGLRRATITRPSSIDH